MSSGNSNSRFGGIIIGPVFAVVGYFVAFHFGQPILDNAKASESWPSVVGVVESSEVTTSRSDGKTMYSPDVVYSFEVEGRSYKSSTISFGGSWSSSNSSDAYKLVTRYPVGTQVDVHYEVGAPSESVLEPGVTWKSYIVFGIGLLFLGVGVLAFGSSALTLFSVGVVVTGVLAGLFGKKDRKFTPPPPGARNQSFATAAHTTGRTQHPTDDGIDIG